ncbi:MAG: hypothetical protein QF570_07635 [Myxococcota bacterium]|jgi:hypothetical protein|nr:hypothetical protein [Myxococcota bacterium]
MTSAIRPPLIEQPRRQRVGRLGLRVARSRPPDHGTAGGVPERHGERHQSLQPRHRQLPLLSTTLPPYIEGNDFTTPFCCYGNNVDCDRCGAWGVFATAAKLPGPWHDAQG